MKKNHKGFSTVEGLLIAVIIILVGFIGWYVWHSKNNTDKTYKTAANSGTNTTSDTKESGGSLDDAKTQAEKVGNGLLTAIKSGNSASSYVTAHSSDGQFTSAFVSSVNNGKAFSEGPLCTNNFDFDSFTASDASISGTSATVTLLQTVSGNSSGWNTHPKLTLIYDNKVWSVDQYICTGS